MRVRTDRVQYYVDQLSRSTLSVRDYGVLNITSRVSVGCYTCGAAVTNANITVRSNGTVVHRGTNATAAWSFATAPVAVAPKFVIQSCLSAPYITPPATITVLPPPDGHVCSLPDPCLSAPCQNGGTCSSTA